MKQFSREGTGEAGKRKDICFEMPHPPTFSPRAQRKVSDCLGKITLLSCPTLAICNS